MSKMMSYLIKIRFRNLEMFVNVLFLRIFSFFFVRNLAGIKKDLR